MPAASNASKFWHSSQICSIGKFLVRFFFGWCHRPRRTGSRGESAESGKGRWCCLHRAGRGAKVPEARDATGLTLVGIDRKDIVTAPPRAGDVIATGTPAGVGAATGKFLAAGDEISCRITGLGELTNTLGDRPADFYRMCP